MERQHALAEALRLALIAPTDEQAERASALAESLAVGLEPVQVEWAKEQASAMAESR